MDRLVEALRPTLAVGAIVGVAAALYLLGDQVPNRPEMALAAAVVVLVLGLTLVEPVALPLLAMPLLLVGARLGLGGVDLSVSDAALALAFWPAVFLSRRPFSPALRNLLWLSGIYQMSTLFTVLANPYRLNAVEWVHQWLLIGGALVVGWAVGRGGYARQGLALVVISGVVLALLTVVQGMIQVASGDLAPVYPRWPFLMHKNFVGTLLAFVAVVAYVRPTWTGWTKRWSLAAFWLMVVAILLTQSRQALIGLGVTLVVVALRRDPHQKRSKTIILAVAPAMALVGSLVQEQVESGNVHNSVFQRISWIGDTIELWQSVPWFGVGMRYWVAGRGLPFQPPNAELEVLASAGVVGLVGFVVMVIGALVVLWRVDPTFGTLAFAVVLSRVVQSQFDIFWVAAQVSVPFVVAGVCLGAQAFAQEAEVTRRLVDAAREPVGHAPGYAT
ncbi:O-antigen ligase family protein [Georgenia muralis]|uniref:O-antigen ligase n=1 Tax=Georgenia muralis TaxID=154117 RepID=A0A3N4ZKR0_9MICO|nr:O-antigen ligase family protein [Georgenia muralis]RPF26398.1 O-antigen ligase [Georgenia muralis]